MIFNKPINRWWTVVAGALGNAAGAGVVATYALGVFIKSISAEFDWDRSYATLGISCFFFASGIGSLILGSLLARHSIRAVAIIFVSLYALTVMSIAALPPSVVIFCAVFLLMGLFGSAATAVPYALVVSRQFDSNRGLALAIMISGAGLGALVMPNYANFLLENYGWRAGYFGIGLLVGLVAVLGMVFFLRAPAVDRGPQADQGLSLKEIVSTLPFWLISLSIFAISIALTGVITNLVPILTDRGMSTAKAASIVGVMGAASWVSRLGIGILLDRIHAKLVAATIFAIATAGVALLAVVPLGVGVYLGAILAGLGIGAEADLITFTISRYFSFASLSRALGAVWIVWAWGNGIGVFAGSLCFDLTGSYDLAFAIFTALGVLSSILVLQLGTYKYPVLHHKGAVPPAAAAH